MPNSTIELANQSYVPVVRNSKTSYGGSQMWLPKSNWNSIEHIIHTYGCGTIATADLFLYLALQKKEYNTTLTSIALQDSIQILYDNYLSYVLEVHNKYTKTKRYLAVLGPSLARAINNYSNQFTLGYVATWKWRLSYYEMLDQMESMLSQDIPVILSIGPNTPKLWGRHGISFYEHKEIEYQAAAAEKVINRIPDIIKNTNGSEHNIIIDMDEQKEKGSNIIHDVHNDIELRKDTNNSGSIDIPEDINTYKDMNGNKDVNVQQESNNYEGIEVSKNIDTHKAIDDRKDNKEVIDLRRTTETENKENVGSNSKIRRKPYYYKSAYDDIHGHYVTVTAIVKDDVAGRIMLRISSWGREYYMNYEEYRDYIESYSGTYTSSIVQIKKDRIYYYHK
ncbi:MAG: hypothetical protein K0R00_4142 [Herbinix sp.]|nr:hypothetical protein [Herbinix sp.]